MADASNKYWGMEEKQFTLFMHLAQFAGFLIPFAGMILPIVMWSVYKDRSEFIDRNGKAIANWVISAFIYSLIFMVLTVVMIGVPLLFGLMIIGIVFPIIGALKASNGETWVYPLSIGFFKTR